MLGKHQREDSTQPGHTLFVTGDTPAPSSHRSYTTTPVSRSRYSTVPTSRAGSSVGEPIELEDSDDEGEDEDEDEAPQYSEAQEALPPCAAYDPATIDLSQRVQGLVTQLHTTLNPHTTSSTDIGTMARKAAKLSFIPEAPKKTVMLLGDTGTGKSSTTNSFVDNPDATKAAATGESCTCVPTLLVSALTCQDREYSEEIRFMYDET